MVSPQILKFRRLRQTALNYTGSHLCLFMVNTGSLTQQWAKTIIFHLWDEGSSIHLVVLRVQVLETTARTDFDCQVEEGLGNRICDFNSNLFFLTTVTDGWAEKQ